ncbi:YkuS family protein [Anaeroselena agilis]|uniref:YkuS family protein n=1 Tax=Anaeroselena agilis TaxID=3063788 RepID=A0ABU3P2R4_9FIRM|nr:YkuS family protein [Selenomonadales bacterium 4137-cl]
MIQGIIAVEQNLSGVIDLLETEGYEVVALDNTDLDSVDAIVVSGADINLMNIQDTLTEVPVISAAGKTAEDILDEIDRL